MTTDRQRGPCRPARALVRPAATARVRRTALVLAAAGFVAAGGLHFVKPQAYERLIPPGLPGPATLVIVSGVAEIVGGLGLLYCPLRRPAGWGLIALLIAVFPANVYMAVRPAPFRDVAPLWLLWARLPLQPVLIAWVAWASGVTRRRDSSRT